MAFFADEDDMMHGRWQAAAKIAMGLILLLLFHKLCIYLGLFPPSTPVPVAMQSWGTIDFLLFVSMVAWVVHSCETDDDDWDQALFAAFIMMIFFLILSVVMIIYTFVH